jgi:hypothetical protein
MNPDLIQYDSQELVADYDDRSEVMRALQQQTMFSPSQDLSFNSIHTSHLSTTLNHDSSHLAPISVPNVTIPSDFDCNRYDSQELVADYDDRSEVMRDLYLKTMISPSQDLMLHSNNSTHLPPTLRQDNMNTSPTLLPTAPFPSHLQHNFEEEMEIDYHKISYDPVSMSGSQSTIGQSSNTNMKEDTDDFTDHMDDDVDKEWTIDYDDKNIKTTELNTTTQMRQPRTKKHRVKQTNKQARQKFNKRNNKKDS